MTKKIPEVPPVKRVPSVKKIPSVPSIPDAWPMEQAYLDMMAWFWDIICKICEKIASIFKKK